MTISIEEFRKLQKAIPKPEKVVGRKNRPTTKKTELQKLIKLADDWFSRRIRLEAANSQRIGKCFVTGKYVDVTYADCGHYHSRRYLATRWDADNAWLQSKMSNYTMGDPKMNNLYTERLIKEIGEDRFNILLKKNNLFKPTVFDLKLIIEENRQIVNQLLKEKEIKKWW